MTAGRSSLLKRCTACSPGEEPVSWTAPAGSHSFLPWQMEENHSCLQQGMKMSCLKYHRATITSAPLLTVFYPSNSSSPLFFCHLSLSLRYANTFSVCTHSSERLGEVLSNITGAVEDVLWVLNRFAASAQTRTVGMIHGKTRKRREGERAMYFKITLKL